MKEKIIVAMDFPTGREALALAEKLRGLVGVFKIGLELFISEGPSLVRAFRNEGHGVFLDLKLHDIPNTVVRSVEAALALDVRMLTLHTSGGGAMMAAAAKARQAAQARTILLGVTVLTSLDDSDLEKIGLRPPVSEQVERLAGLASESGLDGLVCSPHEAGMLKKKFAARPLLLVTPGIRPPGAATGDQKRTMTPQEAFSAGADYLVVGRPITAAPDPVEAAKSFSNLG